MLSESVNQRLGQAHQFPSKDAGFVVIPTLQHYYACLWCPRGKVPPQSFIFETNECVLETVHTCMNGLSHRYNKMLDNSASGRKGTFGSRTRSFRVGKADSRSVRQLVT